MSHTVVPDGPFDLAVQNRYFGGWASLSGTRDSIVMAFPVEGWEDSAAVSLRQEADGRVRGEVHGARRQEAAWRQALAALSLDVDGTGYAAVGERDPVIGRLQHEHGFVRPVLFHSPYEAACSFLIGHRIRIAQGRAIRQRLAERFGDAIDVGDDTVHAFPRPQRLLEIQEAAGLNGEKLERLHGVARAALQGQLDRERLRAMTLSDAVASVRRLRGVGDFFASGIVLRGAGAVDEVPGDPITAAGVQRFYGLRSAPSTDEMTRITEVWRPYRMWCSVLVHAAERRAHGG